MRFALWAPRVAVVSTLAFAGNQRAAQAHSVPGDPDPGRVRYLMPGPLFSIVVPLSGSPDRAPMLMDLGVEVSLHRFVPTSRSIFGQFGYGAFAQAQIGGFVLQSSNTATPAPAPAPHLRLAIGAQGTYGILGAHAGFATRTLGSDQATMLGAFVGVFLTFGFESASFQVELPFVNLGDRQPFPPMFVAMITLKWPVTLEPPDRR